AGQDCAQESAVKNATRTEKVERDQLPGMIAIFRFREEHENLRTDERRQQHPKTQVVDLFARQPVASCELYGEQERTEKGKREKKIVEDGHGGCDGQHNEEPATETSALLQLTKSDSAILRINEIEQAADDGSIVRMPQPAHRPRLAGLVDHVDAEAGEQVTRA